MNSKSESGLVCNTINILMDSVTMSGSACTVWTANVIVASFETIAYRCATTVVCPTSKPVKVVTQCRLFRRVPVLHSKISWWTCLCLEALRTHTTRLRSKSSQVSCTKCDVLIRIISTVLLFFLPGSETLMYAAVKAVFGKTMATSMIFNSLNGYVNNQNCRKWSEANPQVYVETPLRPEKLTVWCTLWAGGILLQKR
ncbi:hypothetical protein TNCV_750731 [Trichonephila clavipes]|nr:hypothetical protein TNCV_750731 [Trichonephila clavipes]